MNDRLLIYGASGYTGRLIVEQALAVGLRPLLAGRSRNKLETFWAREGLRYRVAAVQDRAALALLLSDVDVVLNAAGPFHATALPLARACLERGAHYLDICGEVSVFEALAALDDEARQRGVMLLPGVGFDVVVSDSAAMLLAQKRPDATHLSIGLSGLNAISRGSAATVIDYFAEPVTIRRNGRLEHVRSGELTCEIDFGHGPRLATALGWADISSAYRSTGIPNITVYYDLNPILGLGLDIKRSAPWLLVIPGARLLQQTIVQLLPEGPDRRARAAGGATVVVEARDERGECSTLRVHTPEVYSFTAVASIAIADRVLGGDHARGFQTPSLAFGPHFGLSLPGVRVLEPQQPHPPAQRRQRRAAAR